MDARREHPAGRALPICSARSHDRSHMAFLWLAAFAAAAAAAPLVHITRSWWCRGAAPAAKLQRLGACTWAPPRARCETILCRSLRPDVAVHGDIACARGDKVVTRRRRANTCARVGRLCREYTKGRRRLPRHGGAVGTSIHPSMMGFATRERANGTRCVLRESRGRVSCRGARSRSPALAYGRACLWSRLVMVAGRARFRTGR